ncbi:MULTISPECIES: hypothetical protein [Bacillus cereus group]|uniref:hypothetical protein n=1 Tax=Bacillus cereus group TaxID=86661 RepID=UPI000BED2E57|nr:MULTISPECIES: hypothetical protein [Bacillus cereus group]PEF50997.1 hypothetical protein CON56_18380 [Bacillus thuringiensis]PFC29697.1 hypothetical protein CN299_15505 [Bacillus thuringiensis]PFO96245.1 hypothetical protein COJ97_25030 [Bacillus cereus]
MLFKIGIIDDDRAKVTQIIIKLKQGFSNASAEKQSKYSNYKFEPVEINIEDDIDTTINSIVEKEIDCLLVDYKLSSYKNVDYSGIDIAKKLEDVLYDFPIFVLTSYEDDLFLNEIFNAYQVFDFERYLNEETERIELNYKIIEQILKSKKQIKKWEQDIAELLPKAGQSAEIDKKLLDLDSKLEKSVNGSGALSEKVKKDLDSNKLTDLLNKIDSILSKE